MIYEKKQSKLAKRSKHSRPPKQCLANFFHSGSWGGGVIIFGPYSLRYSFVYLLVRPYDFVGLI